VAAGVTSVLNFAPCVLDVPDHVMVRKVDLSTELQILAFHEQRRLATRLAAEVPARDDADEADPHDVRDVHDVLAPTAAEALR
jgi:redox-sensing transcriptional repressor